MSLTYTKNITIYTNLFNTRNIANLHTRLTNKEMVETKQYVPTLKRPHQLNPFVLISFI